MTYPLLDFSTSPTPVTVHMTDYPKNTYAGVIGSDFDDQIWARPHGPRFQPFPDSTLYGGDGDDQLHAGHRGAIIDGGAGADIMWGATQHPDNITTFVFDSVSDFGDGKGHWDDIVRFNKFDRIDLTRIDADTVQDGHQPFTFIGTAAFDGHAGEVRYQSDGAGGSVVLGDVNGDGVADFELLVNKLTLHSDNFVL